MDGDLVPLLATGGFSLGANDRYSTCVSNVMLYGTETWPVKEQNESRLQRTMMQGELDAWATSDERISAKELKTTLEDIHLRLQDRRLH